MKIATMKRSYYIVLFCFLFCIFVPALRAQTVYFQDDFEHGLGKWTVSGYDWALTTVDYRSSSHSVTDSPGGNYPPNANVAMTLVNAVDLSSSVAPVLTFWHKYATEYYWDPILVEVSKDGGFVWSQIASYTDHCSTWAYVKLSLSSFKTSQVLVRFRLTSNSGSAVDDGWYVDDVEIKETDSLPRLTASVEPSGGGTIAGNGIACPSNCTGPYPFNWIASGRDWGLVTSTYRSASHSVTDSPVGNYPAYANDSITLARALDLRTAVSPVLIFWHKYDTEYYWDPVLVEVSGNGGFTYTSLAAYTNISSTWSMAQFDLSAYKTSQVVIRFRLTSNGGAAVGDGWYLDDVEIKELNSSTRYFYDDFESESSMPASVTLTATPAAGFSFSSWSGCDSVTGDNKCEVAFNVSKNVKATFVATAITPPAATLVSPTGNIATPTPTYTWNAVSSSTWYYLWVNDSTGNKINQWYTSTGAGCAAGTGTCSVTPAIGIAPGSATWWIQTWNTVGYGPWSQPMSFTVAGGAPGAATLISPSGSTQTSTPSYTWNAVAGATWYYLWVNDSSATGKIRTWFTSAQAGCAGGTGTCTVVPSTAIAPGSAQWWIQTWNNAGYGPWSDGMSFTIASGLPGAATLVSPSGQIATRSPAYVWNAVPSATWYYLWINDATAGPRFAQWYTAAQAGCASGSGTCSVTTGVMLSPGAAQWWIQTWNQYGFGPWSAAMPFIVP